HAMAASARPVPSNVPARRSSAAPKSIDHRRQITVFVLAAALIASVGLMYVVNRNAPSMAQSGEASRAADDRSRDAPVSPPMIGAKRAPSDAQNDRQADSLTQHINARSKADLDRLLARVKQTNFNLHEVVVTPIVSTDAAMANSTAPAAHATAVA